MNLEEIPIPEDLVEDVKKYREELIEAVADYDEELLEKFFEDESSITEEEIISALRAATMDMSIIPMLFGSSFKNKVVQALLDSVWRYLPYPFDVEAVEVAKPTTGGKEATTRSARVTSN